MPENDQFILKPTPNEEAAQWLRKMPILKGSVFSKLAPDVKALAFTIGKVQSFDILQKCRDIIAEEAINGDPNKTLKALKEVLRQELSETEAAKKAKLALNWYGKCAVRVGEYEMAQETKDILPYFKYIAVVDSRTRSTHSALNGLVLPVDDPFWEKYMPPWDYNCRCMVIQISERQREKQIELEKKLPKEYRRVLDDKQLELLRKGQIFTGGTMVRLRDPSRQYPSVLTRLKLTPNEVLKRYDKKTQEDFIKAIEGEYLPNYEKPYTVKDWLYGKEPPPMLTCPYRPVTDVIVLKNVEKKTKDAFEEASKLIWEAHDDGILPECVLVNENLDCEGLYRPKDLKIIIDPRYKNQEITIIHEIGHFLHHKAIGNRNLPFDKNSVKSLMEAIKNTPSFERLNLIHLYSKDPEKKEYYKYLMNDGELFARAYLQYILTKNGNWQTKTSKNFRNAHWTEQEFKTIKKEFDKLFISLKWNVKND